MSLSLRTRLTAWYSLLLVLTVAVFSAAVLWLHWRLIIEQFDESLRAVSSTAINVVEEELGEVHDLGHAAAEMIGRRASARRRGAGARCVWRAAFTRRRSRCRCRPKCVRRDSRARLARSRRRTAMLWRVTVRQATADGYTYFVAVGAPLDEAIEQWNTLLRACLIGIPLALVFAVGGGLWLGRHGTPAADGDGRGGPGDYREDARPAPDRAAVRVGAGAARGVVQHRAGSAGQRARRRSASSWPTRRTSCGRRCRSCGPPPT